MTLSATDKGSLEIAEIPPFLFHLLKEIPIRAASTDLNVENRFFPAPARDETILEDWKSLVQPELQAAFLSAREVVMADLRQGSEQVGTLAIPRNHVDAWLNALNQARLAIATENHFEEKDMADEVSPDPANPRSLALFQIGFYGFLQECLVRMQEEEG